MTAPLTSFPGQLCSCGRPAVCAFPNDRFGSVGFCGIPGWQPLHPHRCDVLETVHDQDYCTQLLTRRPGGKQKFCGQTPGHPSHGNCGGYPPSQAVTTDPRTEAAARRWGALEPPGRTVEEFVTELLAAADAVDPLRVLLADDEEAIEVIASAIYAAPDPHDDGALAAARAVLAALRSVGEQA